MPENKPLTIRLERVAQILKDPNLTEQEKKFRMQEYNTLKGMITE